MLNKCQFSKFSRMKKLLILQLFVFVSLLGISQTIDSVHFSYNQASQELDGFIAGELLWSDPNQDIVAINSSIIGDTVFLDVHFELCQTFPLNSYYDSLFTQSQMISSGQKVVKVISYLDENLDTASCYFQASTVAVDTAYFNLDIPIGLDEDRGYGVVLSPNPSNGIFRIECEAYEVEEVHVFDVTGRRIQMNVNDYGIVDISSVPDGVYLIQIMIGPESVVCRYSKYTY